MPTEEDRPAPITIRGTDGRVHIVTDMAPADNRRADEQPRPIKPALIMRSPS